VQRKESPLVDSCREWRRPSSSDSTGQNNQDEREMKLNFNPCQASSFNGSHQLRGRRRRSGRSCVPNETGDAVCRQNVGE
jgi:hypothetical protein